MANLPETSVWPSGIYQIETTDPVLGGAPNESTGGGMTNIPHVQLARRTLWLRDYALALQGQVDALLAQLTQLNTSRPVVAPVLVATTANIALSGLQTIDGVSVTAGRRVLVKNQTAPAQNGVYVAASGAWARATDFDQGSDIVPGTIVAVTAGTTQAETLWSLSSGGEGDTITVGSTALAFTNATALMAPLASPQFTGAPTAPTPAQFNDSTLLANTAFVQRALGNMAGYKSIVVNATLLASDAGCQVQVNGAVTVTLPALASVPDGASFHFRNDGLAAWTLAAQAGQLIHSGIVAQNAFAMPFVSSTFSVVKVPGAWHLRNSLVHDGGMAASLASNGWQRLPSGLIMQWGTVTQGAGLSAQVTFPIAFPTGCQSITAIHAGSAGAMVIENSGARTASGTILRIFNDAGIQQSSWVANWIAVGY